MTIDSTTKRDLPFYLLAAGFFLIIISPDIFSDGMFMDGLIYSTVAKNLSDGLGTFWNPHFTATCLPDFHEHPPLAFGLQSISFTLFGSSRYIDKIYSLFIFVIIGYIILYTWKFSGFKHGWLPLLIWFTFPPVKWASGNNMLESTLAIFILLSVLFYLKRQKDGSYFFVFLSGLMLSFGFLTKGFVAFFPWTFPFIWWLFIREKSFRSMITDSIGIVAFTILPLAVLVLISTEAKQSLLSYIDVQVVNSLKNVETVDSRFFIVKQLFLEFIPAIGISLVFIIWGRRKKFSFNLLKSNSRKAGAFFLLGLMGVLPIMISMKQRGFYLLPTFPVFAIAVGILLYPLVEFLFANLNYKSKGFTFFKWTANIIFLTGIVLCFYFAEHGGRDRAKIKDIRTILTELPNGTIINIYPALREDWSLHGYFARFKNVSLDHQSRIKRDYFLIHNSAFSDTLQQDYELVELQTTEYKLFKKK